MNRATPWHTTLRHAISHFATVCPTVLLCACCVPLQRSAMPCTLHGTTQRDVTTCRATQHNPPLCSAPGCEISSHPMLLTSTAHMHAIMHACTHSHTHAHTCMHARTRAHAHTQERTGGECKQPLCPVTYSITHILVVAAKHKYVRGEQPNILLQSDDRNLRFVHLSR